MASDDFWRKSLLNLSTMAQLAYVAHKQGETVVKSILESGYSPFITSYSFVEFLYTNSIFNNKSQPVCCGLIAANEREIIISIRGTENLDDYFLNLLAHVNEDKYHTGFATYVDSFWSKIVKTLSALDDGKRGIFITGHSLGGAAAIIISQRLHKAHITQGKLLTFTFGSPPVSTEQIITNQPIYQFQNEGDFIPFLPQIMAVTLNIIPGLKLILKNWNPVLVEALFSYNHQGQVYLIDRNYQIRLLDESEISSLWTSFTLSASWLPKLTGKNPMDIFHNLLNSLINNSFEEHRAITYVERLNFGIRPPWGIKASLPRGN